MAEKLTFHFEGALADKHRMNFYESARFQYAAARLMVKLAQFREKGKFVKKISNKSNFNVQLISQSDGSFNINVEDSSDAQKSDDFVKIPLSDLIAYVSERIVGKIEQDDLKLALMPDSVDDHEDFSEEELSESLNGIIYEFIEDDSLIESLDPDTQEMVKRRIAEIYREKLIADNQEELSKIDFNTGERLVAMAAPLLSEMANTSLRRSADSFEITSSSDMGEKSVLFLDRKMAKEIETATVDSEITPILGDVFQFNKDNGWGKIKIEEGTKVLSFNIPYDRLASLKQSLIDQMKVDLVNLQTYFVRDRAGDVIRLIVVGILATPTV